MEHLIDIFARDPNSLSDTDRDRIDALLDENPGFREYLDHLRDFYRSFRELSAENVPDHVRSFADSLVRLPRRLMLRAPASRKPGSSRGSGYRFLRADTATASGAPGSASSGSLRAAGSLVCTEYGVLLRLIEDRDAGELRGYVLSPDQRDASESIVRFEQLDTPRVADTAGVVRIPMAEVKSTVSLLAGVVELMLPVRTAGFRPVDLPSESFATLVESDSLRLEARSTDTGVRMRVSGASSDGFLVIDSAGLRTLHRLDVDELDIDTGDLAEEVGVRIYAD